MFRPPRTSVLRKTGTRNGNSSWRVRPLLECLNARITPATASLSAGVLTIDYLATGATAETVTLTNNGTDIALTGNISGSTSNPVAGVTRIVVQDSGGSSAQSVKFAGTAAYSLSAGLSCVGVETVTVSNAINVTGSSLLSVTAPKTIAVNANLSTVDGNLILTANQQSPASKGSFVGIDVNNATISSTTGLIELKGRGGDSSFNTNPDGVRIHRGAIVGSGTTGPVNIHGTGGAVSPRSDGVYLGSASPTSTVTSGGGPVSVVGYGGGTLTSVGVNVGFCQITAGGTGAVTVQGFGIGWEGVFVGGTIASSGGPVSVIGSSTGTSFAAITLSGGSSLVSSGGTGQLTITTDSFDISGTGPTIRAGTNGDATVTFAPSTAGTKINMGGADVLSGSPRTLGLTDTELDRVFAGTLQIGDAASAAITVSANITRPVSTNVTLTTGGTINFAAGLDSAGGAITLSSAGAITQTAGTVQTVTGTLTPNAPGQTVTFASIGNKAATLVIPANVTCLVNGSFDSTGAVQVDGTLGGSGSVGTTTVTGTGKIAPGTSPGKLTTGNIALNSGSKFSVELNGLNPGTDYDQLVVGGTVNLGGATLQGTLGFTPTANQVITIIDNDGTSDAVTGTFNGLIEGATTKIGAWNFKVSYQGGDGNDVTLTALGIAPPTVVSAYLSDDTGLPVTHRSTIRKLVVNFSEPVSFSGPVAQAFSLFRSLASTSPGPNGLVDLTAIPATGPASSVTITFTGPLTDYRSLKNGIYDLTIDAAQISGAGGALDGDGNGAAGGNYLVIGSVSNLWFRFFGDYGNDQSPPSPPPFGPADGALTQYNDFIAFRNAYGSGSTVFDFFDDGVVDQGDLIQIMSLAGFGP